jgi:serpin B
LALLLLLFPGCSDFGTTTPQEKSPDGQAKSRPLSAAEQGIVKAGNAFGFHLLSALNSETAGKNLFISPLSVSMALGMTFNGANGSTRKAMQQTLQFAGMSEEEINRSYASVMLLLTQLDPKVKLQVANSIWHRPTLVVEEAFRTINRQYFNAEVSSIDFASPAAAPTINSWVDKSTNGKITRIVPAPIPPEVVMYLINAGYFKGTWTYRFETKDTRDEPFTLPDGSQKICKMMSQTVNVPYFVQEGVQGIDLPYGNALFSLTVLLPPAGVTIDNFIAGLTEQQWDSYLAQASSKEVSLFMPKFKLEYETSLRAVLSALGMAVAFSDSADFTRIDRRGSLSISEVKHKTFVQLDEEGTEAAAVTSVGIVVTSVGGGPLVLRLDRPFLYVIRERQTGTILFMGKMAEPAF